MTLSGFPFRFYAAALLLINCLASSFASDAASARERLSFDQDWRFALGHATDVSKDFNHATGGFSYFAKAGFGAGASDPKFDDRGWRKLNLPHDWAVELPFSERGSVSHGFKAIGRNFPENSVGWYRKTFHVPKSDLGKRISLEFDGVFRDSIVWVNGHYLGAQQSGYSSFARNISEILNYGGDNVVVVRVDASLEEGWFYEGAGIYRHVWLAKTAPLHVERHGTFVTSELQKDSAAVTARVTVVNESMNPATLEIEQTVLAPDGKALATARLKKLKLTGSERREFTNILAVANPQLWSIETPQLHKLVTTIRSGGAIVDQYETTFGIRSIRFDPNEGFFLNGKRVKLKGTDNHQDHAGVGAAIPDALQEFRIAALKKFGCNAYRASHNPPTPELLDVCDRLGMLVIDENRLMGTTEYHYDHLKRMILRDRNHPSVVLWSVGNEEWRIEGAEPGTRITAAMQACVKQLDATRPVTVAISGGWGRGNSVSIEAAGLNYLGNMGKSGFTTDQWHAKRPEQIIVGTEECAFTQTRGIYFDDRPKCHLRAYDWDPSDWGASAEQGWSHYADRNYLAGMFVWTGFDYRGEPTPFGWPAVASQFGILDLCGFPKDAAFYFQAWWRNEPLLHVFPHWNWPGKEGEEISVWAHSNCDEVELFLNGQSLGRKVMKKYSHLEWSVKYAPGTLSAKGYDSTGNIIAEAKRETTGETTRIEVTPDRKTINADGEDVAVFSVTAYDAQGRFVPVARNKINFAVERNGKIIGVGNGDPSCHEPDTYVSNPSVRNVALNEWRWKTGPFQGRDHSAPEYATDFDDSSWSVVKAGNGEGTIRTGNTAAIYRTHLTLTAEDLSGPGVQIHFAGCDDEGWYFVNAQYVGETHDWDAKPDFDITKFLRIGDNVIAVCCRNGGANGGLNPNVTADIIAKPAELRWSRSLFNGLAQVIVQSTKEAGEIKLTATAAGLAPATVTITALPCSPRQAVP